jgi:predicted ATPase
MLKSVSVKKFKQLSNVSEDLDRVTVLVGTNNSGKSSFLQAIHSAVSLSQSRLRQADQETMTTEETGFTISPQDTLYLPLVNTSWLAPEGKLTQTSGPVISFTFVGEPAPYGSVEIKRGKNRNLSVKLKGRTVISRIEELRQPFSVYVPGLAGISKNEAFIGFGNLLRAVARGDANLVLRNVLNALRQNPEQWGTFTRALRRVFPDKAVIVRFDQQADEFINVVVKKGELEIPLDAVGTSFLQTVQILSYVYLFRPVVTLLDEPDSHLHPNNQRALADLLWDLAAEGRTQVVLATHSRHILDVLREKEGVKFLWCKSGTTRPASVNLDILTELGALDSAEGLLAGGVQFVVLTEDKKKKMFKTLLAAHGAREPNYQIWAYKGCSRQDVAQALANFIHEVSPRTDIIVHRDFDYLQPEDEARLRQSHRDTGLKLFLTPGVDVEGIFCRIEHLKAVNPAHAQLLEGMHGQALAECAADLRDLARKGAEQVDHLRHKSGVPTQGREAIVQWSATLDVTTERWIHGKTLLAKLRHLFQQTAGTQLAVEVPSPHLQLTSLENLLPRPTAPAPTPAPPPAIGPTAAAPVRQQPQLATPAAPAAEHATPQ